MDEITDRFITVYKTLISDGRVKNLSDFSKKIGVSTSLINEIDKKRSKVGLVAIQNTVIAFKISPTWLLTGKGKMNLIETKSYKPDYDPPQDILLNKPSPELYKTIGKLEYQIEMLKDRIKHLEEENEALKKENKTYSECLSKRS